MHTLRRLSNAFRARTGTRTRTGTRSVNRNVGVNRNVNSPRNKASHKLKKIDYDPIFNLIEETLNKSDLPSLTLDIIVNKAISFFIVIHETNSRNDTDEEKLLVYNSLYIKYPKNKELQRTWALYKSKSKIENNSQPSPKKSVML